MILFNSNKLLSVSDRILNTSSFSYDADALAFISAATITASTQMMAINDLVIDLKAFGLWNKMIAIYPFVGGTANSHKYNLKDPRDSDAAYRLVFSGGWTHSSTGALPNGTNTYADTKLIPSTSLSLNSTHLSYYSLTNSSIGGTRYDMGTGTGTVSDFLSLVVKFQGANFLSCLNQTTIDVVANAVSTGFYCSSRTGATTKFMIKNNSVVLTTSTVSTALAPNSLYIGAYNNNGTANLFGDKECAFASVGSGLTTTESINLYTAVQKYQGALNRKV